MKIGKNIWIGLFWIDRQDKRGLWHYHGKDYVTKLRLQWEIWFPIPQHPMRSKCPSFGRFYTSGGNDPIVGCSIRYGQQCRAGLQVRQECERVTKLGIKERKRLGL